MISIVPNTIKKYCLTTIKNQWLESDASFPDFLIKISTETKLQNEQYMQKMKDDFHKQFDKFPRFPFRRKKWKQETFTMINNALTQETIIGINHVMNQEDLDNFQNELNDFLRTVRKFAPELSFDGIGQATRNYVVYYMFKQLNQLHSGLSNACFGYSMLYPFTDNYIDSNQFSSKEKAQYNQMIRDKIKGNKVSPNSYHQQKTCDLLQAIESDYPRNYSSTIYTLLTMMLDAQEDSIRQQSKNVVLTLEERLNISLYKGGISVLIDQFFVKNEITETELNFYLGFGFFLQLADDLQDIKEDSMQGNQTIFTYHLEYENIENITNKMFHFIHQLSASYSAPSPRFLNFLLTNCYQLMYLSIIRSKEFFSKEYLNKLETFLPFHFAYTENINEYNLETKDLQTQKKYLKILDAMVLK